MNKKPLLFILLSAVLFGISAPLAKLLVRDIPAVALAGLLYLGAFAGLTFYALVRKKDPHKTAAPLEHKDLPWLAGAVVCGGIIAPICLMTGLALVSGFSASLLLNLEGVVTAVLAVFLFREHGGKRLWLALACMTIAGVFLAWSPERGEFNLAGPLLILLAMAGWGVDNNLTRRISGKDPVRITQIKGLAAGTVSLAIALILRMKVPLDVKLLYALVLGAFSYGASLVFFIRALEGMGSARAGAFFSFAPFVGALASLVFLREWIGWVMFPAAVLMATGAALIAGERHVHAHVHGRITHTHSHRHDDLHHRHAHEGTVQEPHTHEHTHDETTHRHVHWPDTHHRHEHE